MSVLFPDKKIAIVHDWLNGMRGGEKCLEVFCEIFPQAHLYTLIHEQGKLSDVIEAMDIRTSALQKIPGGLTHYRHFLPLMPKLVEQFKLDDYDIILSSSHCVAKGISYADHPFHISYVHAPMRYMWHLFDTYFSQEKVGWGVRLAALTARPMLQKWDVETSSRVHALLSNSQNVRKQIQKYYYRDAQVIYPPVDLEQYYPGGTKQRYYLMVGAFAPNKRTDLAIKAFNRAGYPLRIAGTGQEEAYCRSIASANIEFLGNVSDDELRILYQEARAFIFPGEDDFGITPLEAQACGTPVIAFGAGGALETVTEQTGIFFYETNDSALYEAIEQMEDNWKNFDPHACVLNATRFGRERFKMQMSHAVEFGYQQWKQRSGKSKSPLP
ncbi:MAG: glycosyltransferase [SAR324 cluster bacterium]|nr:glycosyltransferase [SAR324 cluster bacterium]